MESPLQHRIVTPWDTHNQTLVANVRPAGWTNPVPASRYNLVVVGAGSAGLITAAGAAGLGAKVALVERHLMGGDCLNVGCVPSKALVRAARACAEVRDAGDFGVVVPPGVLVDFPRIMERMRELRARISPNDSALRYQKLGVDVFFGEGKFTGSETLEVNGQNLRFAKAVIASGTRAASLQIPGLADAGFLTNETIFSLTELPQRLAVIGAGPIGCELAQAFRRFGSTVTLFESESGILPREDQDAAEVVRRQFNRDGIETVCDVRIVRIEKTDGIKVIHFEQDGKAQTLEADEILVSGGRVPNVEGLHLDVADVNWTRQGVQVNDFLQTTNRRIYAAGDICLRHKFTHTADAAARIVIQNALFGGRKRMSSLTVPWCTYTDPEIAHVGIDEQEAARKGIAIRTYTQRFEEVDRAILDGERAGLVKVHVREGTDRVIGATIVARHAGEMISELTVAMTAKVGLAKLANIIHPYPTQAEAIKKIADAYNRSRLTPLLKRLLSAWLAWTR
jgi:pyruvate/2-oxoglutarate dehydrogenase complex dihydrolipoamide dehydrogenase (E3) component